MPENHEHSRYIYNSYYYDGHRLDPSDLDLKAYIDERIAASPGGSSYLVYMVKLNGGVGVNPTATEFINELGVSPVWTRVTDGEYHCTQADLFVETNLFIPAPLYQNNGGWWDENNGVRLKLVRISNNALQLQTNEAGIPTDGWLDNTPIMFYIKP